MLTRRRDERSASLNSSCAGGSGKSRWPRGVTFNVTAGLALRASIHPSIHFQSPVILLSIVQGIPHRSEQFA